MKDGRDPCWKVVKILPTDYTEYGGEIQRWADNEKSYPDCSTGCRWWKPLYCEYDNGPDGDWGVCVSPRSPRAGLLTWEHQAGEGCWEMAP